MSSITPSPFRFITSQKQPPRQRQGSASTFPPKSIAPGQRSLDQGYDNVVWGLGRAGTENEHDEGENAVLDKRKQPKAKKGLPGPSAFSVPGRQQVEIVQAWEESDEERTNCKPPRYIRKPWGLGNRRVEQQEGIEPDIESPVKRRRIKERDAPVLNELMVEDGIEEVGWDIDEEEIDNIEGMDSAEEVRDRGNSEDERGIGEDRYGQEGEESEVDGVVMNLLGRSSGVGEGGVAEEDIFLECLPTTAELVKVSYHAEPITQTTSQPSTSACLSDAHSDAYQFLSPLPPTAPRVSTQNPLRFRVSSLTPRHNNILTSAAKNKPNKPASFYFRTILAPPHQRNYETDRQQINLPLDLTIPSDWSPSKKWRRRGRTRHSKLREDGGKYMDGGLANQVLGWTLESLSSSGRGAIFGHGGETGGEGEVWRMVQVVAVSGCNYRAGGLGKLSNGTVMANLSLGGIVVGGEETDGSRIERRRYLLVTGRGAITLGGERAIESLKADEGRVRYKSPWWDMRLDEDEEIYRVLCMWDVVNGSEMNRKR